MGRKIFISESQLKQLFEVNILMESIFEVESLDEFKEKLKNGVKKMLLMGVAVSTIFTIVNAYCENKGVDKEVASEVIETIVNDNKSEEPVVKINKENNDWDLASSNVMATVYNAVPSQCDGDCRHTASMFRLNLNNVLSHRIIAMERTFMQKLGLKYGDVVKIEGTGKWDGVWQVQDLMNKRFKGKEKIDILVPNEVKQGKWDGVKLYILKDKNLTNKYKENMAPQAKK